ncbi:MAG TPA: hypothetical protein VFR11_23000 [Micromonosporaceae bacterium]|jgi:hypothetical protein|nr:hypothetical protein [Micromonosporaceae bacterium]
MKDDEDVLRGLPQTRHDPLTFPGGIEQWGKIANATGSQTGWRRTVARTGFALLAVAVILTIVSLVIVGH